MNDVAALLRRGLDTLTGVVLCEPAALPLSEPAREIHQQPLHRSRGAHAGSTPDIEASLDT